MTWHYLFAPHAAIVLVTLAEVVAHVTVRTAARWRGRVRLPRMEVVAC